MYFLDTYFRNEIYSSVLLNGQWIRSKRTVAYNMPLIGSDIHTHTKANHNHIMLVLVKNYTWRGICIFSLNTLKQNQI